MIYFSVLETALPFGKAVSKEKEITMYNYHGKTALITGASTGIGASFARQLAAQGMNLVLVARSEQRLQALATELSKEHRVKVEVIPADLSRPGTAANIYETTRQRGINVDMLINNAGISTFGDFDTISPQKQQEEIAINVASVVDMTHAFIPGMLEKGEGAIINVASIVGFFPLPNQAVYGATKAFVLSFSEALFVEYEKRGIKVFTLCPGPVATEFFESMGASPTTKAATPDEVVKVGLKAFQKGRHYVTPGVVNSIQANWLPRLLWRSAMARLVGSVSKRIMRSHSPEVAATAQTKS
jgi:uncharacterized protein